jgi:hypothetical protein
MVQLVHEDFLQMHCVGCEGCAVCSEFEADSLHGCHLSFDHIQGPTGLAMCLPYPVEIAAMYFFLRSIITDKSVVSSLKSVQHLNCPATVPAPPVIADYNMK